VGYENNDKKMDSVYSKRIKAGKRRTYFFDVRATKGNDYYLTITESRKRFNEESYERHKIFLYKEDFNKFLKGLGEAVDYVKTDLMPDFDFDAFNHEYPEAEGEFNGFPAPSHNGNGNGVAHVVMEATLSEPVVAEEVPVVASNNGTTEEVDKW
jgi:hypothetical protein